MRKVQNHELIKPLYGQTQIKTAKDMSAEMSLTQV